MMNLGEHFGRDERSRHSEWLRQRKWFIKAKTDHKRREELEARADENGTAFSVAMATPLQIETFERKLDAYDTAIVTALMENQRELDRVRDQINEMLSHAHVLEDGRRVFKSEDGSFVIDEHGQSVSADEVDFDAISPSRPTAEQFLKATAEEAELVQERERIHEFQGRVDAARERIDAGEISESELDELDAELSAAIPSSVKVHLSDELNPTASAPDMRQEFRATRAATVITPRASPAAMELDG